jgi:hypothetical protein
VVVPGIEPWTLNIEVEARKHPQLFSGSFLAATSILTKIRTLLYNNMFFSCFSRESFPIRSEHMVQSACILPLKEAAQHFAFPFP